MSETNLGTREHPLQSEQQRLEREALKIPGVAEAVEVYSSLRRFTPLPASPPPIVRFATGGNV